MFDIEIIGNKINPYCKDSDVWYPLGQLTCMIAAGETDWIKKSFKVITDWRLVEEKARDYLESCFHSNDVTDKTKGYLFCRSKYPFAKENYTVTKCFSEITDDGNTKLQIKDCYHFDNIVELIDFETMYATANNISIFVCKNCGKYFATLNSGAVYCDRIFKDNKTCKYFGAKKTSAEQVKNNELISFYEKSYQAIYYKKRIAKNKTETKKIDNILKALQKNRLEYRKGNLSDEKFRSIIEGYLVDSNN